MRARKIVLMFVVIEVLLIIILGRPITKELGEVPDDYEKGA